MFTLIKRELRDNWISFLVVLAYVALILFILIGNTIFVRMKFPVGIPICMTSKFPLFIFVPVIIAWVSGSQIFLDRSRKITGFLCTLAATRGQVFAARIITGLLLVSVVTGAIALTYYILLKYYTKFILPFDIAPFLRIFATCFLLCVACYSLGMLAGNMRYLLLTIATGLILSAIVISLIIIKGCGVQSWLLLLFITTGALWADWQKCMQTSL